MVQTIFKLNDQTTRPLMMMSQAATRVSSMFDRASSVVGTFGAVAGVAAGAFSAKDAISGTMELLKSTKRVMDYTGMSADNAGAFLDMMEEVGIESHEATRALTRMSMTTARMQMSAMGMRHGLSGARGFMQQLGIAGKTPEQQLYRMAELAEQNKLSATQLQTAFHMMPESARKLMDLLRQGPGKIKAQADEFKKLQITTAENVALVHDMQLQQARMKSTWGDIQAIMAVQFLPVIKAVLDKVESKMEAWKERARELGVTLKDFVLNHFTAILRVVKLLMLNFVLLKATGMGMGGWLAAIVKGGAGMAVRIGKLGGVAGAGAGAAGGAAALPALAAAAVAAGAILLAVLAWKRNVGDVQRKMGMAWERLVSHAKVIQRMTEPVLKRILMVFKVNSPLDLMLKVMAGMMVYVADLADAMMFTIAVAIRMGQKWWDGIVMFVGVAISQWGELAMLVKKVFVGAWVGLSGMIAWYAEIFSGMFKAIKEALVDPYVRLIDQAMQQVAKLIDTVFGPYKKLMAAGEGPSANILGQLTATMDNAIAAPVDFLKQAIADVEKEARFERQLRAAQQSAELAAQRRKIATPPDRMKQPNCDFRGSRFDITQKFAEGFDPDRIAVAFTNDLAALGERRLQSGFSPLFTVG
jgi:hypothetical protein